MSSLITCTPGGSTDNSYVTVAQANTYYANTLREPLWDDYAEDDRERALIQATQQLEALGGARTVDSPSRSLFWGEPYDTSTPQALHFPRSDDLTTGGIVAIPQAVKDAVCEQALWLLQQRDAPPLLDHAANQAAGISNLSLDGINVSYKGSSIPRDIAPAAWAKFSPYVRKVF